MFGLLNVNKPAGITSRDVVNRVQRLVKPHKAGHAGTLDPLATGVLIVCIGQATRLIEFVQRMPKRYVGTFLLARTSDTEDVEGTVVELTDSPVPTREQIEAALPSFVGKILQTPPAYSALKVAGKRAYALARKGAEVTLEPRPIEVHCIELVRYEYPELVLDIRCGSGTYVRSLGRDIARSVGTEAVMSALERTEIGPFVVGEAVPYDSLNAVSLAANLRPAADALPGLPLVELTADEVAELANGRRIANRSAVSGDEIAGVDSAGRLCALLKSADDGQLQPTRFFPVGAEE
jgi:tRNA pseudouridine55 synthase